MQPNPAFHYSHAKRNYLPFLGGLLPLPPPEGLPVWLGALGGVVL